MPSSCQESLSSRLYWANLSENVQYIEGATFNVLDIEGSTMHLDKNESMRHFLAGVQAVADSVEEQAPAKEKKESCQAKPVVQRTMRQTTQKQGKVDRCGGTKPKIL
jgi:hypothetical protein